MVSKRYDRSLLAVTKRISEESFPSLLDFRLEEVGLACNTKTKAPLRAQVVATNKPDAVRRAFPCWSPASRCDVSRFDVCRGQTVCPLLFDRDCLDSRRGRPEFAEQSRR